MNPSAVYPLAYCPSTSAIIERKNIFPSATGIEYTSPYQNICYPLQQKTLVSGFAVPQIDLLAKSEAALFPSTFSDLSAWSAAGKEKFALLDKPIVQQHRIANAIQDAQLKRTLFNIFEGSIAHKTNVLQSMRALLAHPAEQALLGDLMTGRPVASERVVDVMVQDRQRDAVILGLLDEMIKTHVNVVAGPQGAMTKEITDYAFWKKDLQSLGLAHPSAVTPFSYGF